MSRKSFFKYAALFIPILLMTIGIRLLVQASGGNSIYLPVIERSSTCTVPSADYATIQAAIDDKCPIINLGIGLYSENLYISDLIVVIRGQGPANTTIQNINLGSVIRVLEDAELTLENVTVKNGNAWSAPGGGIRNEGVTHLFNTVIKENYADDEGGGVYSVGTLTVEDSWILDNNLSPNNTGSDGGGVFILGTARFTNTVISGNEAYSGGGLYAGITFSGTVVTLVNSEVSDNDAHRGGGIFSTGYANVLITNSLISGNLAKENLGVGAGGGILNFGDLKIIGSLIVGNTAAGQYPDSTFCGGGIMNSQATSSSGEPLTSLFIDRTEFRNNLSHNHGGGICYSTFGGLGEVEIYNSLFVGNSSIGDILGEGGGYYSESEHVNIIENTTFVNNSASIAGGAIAAHHVELRNVTIANNDAMLGGGIFSWDEVKYVNTIMAGNLTGNDCETYTSAVLTSLGHNIDSDGSCNLIGPGDMPNTSPMLGPLQNNGGPTFTMALILGSPAIDTADNTACPPTDQRGVTRPQGTICDRGAYEYDG